MEADKTFFSPLKTLKNQMKTNFEYFFNNLGDWQGFFLAQALFIFFEILKIINCHFH